MKRIILISFFMAITSVVMAQRFEGGVLAGYNATQVSGDNYTGYNKPGVLFGGFVQTDLAPAVFAGLELKYSQKGSRNKIDTEDLDNIEKYIMRLGYIELPVFFGFRANEKGSVIGGISTGYLVHAKEYDENGPFSEEDEHAFSNIDLQPFLGFQFDLKESLTLDLRLAYSVLPVRDQPGEETSYYYWINNQFNNVISLAIYYKINQGRY